MDVTPGEQRLDVCVFTHNSPLQPHSRGKVVSKTSFFSRENRKEPFTPAGLAGSGAAAVSPGTILDLPSRSKDPRSCPSKSGIPARLRLPLPFWICMFSLMLSLPVAVLCGVAMAAAAAGCLCSAGAQECLLMWSCDLLFSSVSIRRQPTPQTPQNTPKSTESTSSPPPCPRRSCSARWARTPTPRGRTSP